MTWLAPAALAGALLVALPILIHMMGRGRTTVIRFPSLRFLESSRILPARRTRIHDFALLMLRAGAIVAAAVALAQPLFRGVPAAVPVDAGLSRVVVIDTSASMRRATATTSVSDSLAAAAARVVVVRAADLHIALRGAAAWAATESGHVDIAVVSDFQLGALDSADLAGLDPEIGISLHRVRPAGAPLPLVARTRQGGFDVTARIALAGDRTDVEWSTVPPVARASSVQLRSASTAADLIMATRRGAEAVGVPTSSDTTRADVAVVFPGDASLASIRTGDHPLASRRQAGIVARLLADPLVDATGDGEPGALPAFDRAVSAVENGMPLLTIVSRAPVGTAASAALVAAVGRAASTAAPVSELEPDFIPDATLASWERGPGDRPALKPENPAEPPEFDGRWFWMLALLLIAAETLLRRSARYTTHVV